MKARRLRITPEFWVMMLSRPEGWRVIKNRLPEDAKLYGVSVNTRDGLTHIGLLRTVDNDWGCWPVTIDLWITSSVFDDVKYLDDAIDLPAPEIEAIPQSVHQQKSKGSEPKGCPKCGGQLKVSDHIYFDLDVKALRCHACKLFSIEGADRWIQFPIWTGDRKQLLGMPAEWSEEEVRNLQAYEAERQKRTGELRMLASEVSQQKVRTNDTQEV